MRSDGFRLAVFGVLVLVASSCGAVKGEATDASVDPCLTNTCACTPATQAADCGAHEVCDTTSTPGRVCACAPAYAKTGGGACTFAGAPADPAMSDATKWVAAGAGASIDATLPGNVDPGEAVITHDGMCGFASLSQTFTMPPLDRAEPFKLVVTHTGVEPSRTFSLSGSLLQIGVGAQWIDLPVQANAYRTDSICLGAAAYGGPVKFQVGTFGASPLNCTAGAASTAVVKVDQIAVQVAAAGECPAPGTVINGDFEAATGWTFSSLGTGTGALVAGIGENASKAAQLNAPDRCASATMTGTMSFPTRATMANPAIDLYWNGPPGDRLVFQLAGKNVATLNASGTPRHSRVCVPAWAVGSVTSAGVYMQEQSENACTAIARSFVLDNITLVNDPACNATGDLVDPGFERIANLTGPVTGWGITQAYVNDTQGITVNASNSAAVAHSGNGALRMSWLNQCTGVGSAGADFAMIVPPASGAAGPAVKFFANAPATNTMTMSRLAMFPVATGSPVLVDAAETGAFVATTLCLPPALATRRINLRASIGNDNGGGCTMNQPTESATFDDFEITTDPACAAQ